ncbi:MAG: hypothetical protein CFE33_17765 [Pseudorhodobacter sp. PARRP1]|nr:MAG: hypothetical protein CFE33_17765 [Pseudorhodobacter sp. PARRP1]
MVEVAPCGIVALGPEGQIEYINHTLLDWLGRSRDQLLGKFCLSDIFNRAGFLYFQTHLLPMLRLNEGFQEASLPLRTLGGVERQTLVAGRQVDAVGRAVLIFCAADERAGVQKELAHIRETAKTRLTWLDQIERMANIGAWSVDLMTGETTWSDQVFAIHDLPVGQPPTLEVALSFYPIGVPRETVETFIGKAAKTGRSFQFETTICTEKCEKKVRSSGGVEWEKGKIRRLVGIFEDITEESKATEKLWRAAHIDALSGLANRTWFQERLAEQVTDAQGRSGSFHLLLLDIDSFKEINDAYGHSVGDAVIRITSERICAIFGQDAIIGRFGGDEFAVVPNTTFPSKDIHFSVERLATELRGAIVLAGVELNVGISIGITRFPQDATTQEGLVKCAEMALLHAKRMKKGGTAVFDWHIRSAADQRRAAIERVRNAAAAGQIVAHYQPRIDLATGEICGYEALARILEPGGEASGPSSWGSALHDPICARLIDQHVLRAVVADWPKLFDRLQAAKTVQLGRIGINTSEHSLKYSDFVAGFLDQLLRGDIPTSAIEIEVLETVLVSEGNPLLGKKLAQLRQEGVSVALDDFGTGFASLMHLRDLPVDRIKLDQSFVRDLDGDVRNRPIVRATVELGHALGMKIVAEGIERQSAHNFLQLIGCDEGQGFLFGRPAAMR